MKDTFFIRIDDNGISLSSNMLTWIEPSDDNSLSLNGYHLTHTDHLDDVDDKWENH